jgi:DNA ligase-1
VTGLSAAPELTLSAVADAFAAMAIARTTAIRASLVEGLLERATPLEAKYLLKLMIGDMRIGVKQSLVEEAIAVAADAAVSEVRHAVMLEADLSFAVQRAFAGTLKEARMRLFHPLGFMLASPVETPGEAVERFMEKPVAKSKSANADPSTSLRSAQDDGSCRTKTRIEISIRVFEILPRRCRSGGSPVPFQSRVDDRHHSV